MIDAVLVSVPYTAIEVPPLSLAVFKGAVESNNLSAKAIDLNMMLYKQLDKDRALFDQYQLYFAEHIISADIEKLAAEFLDRCAITLLDLNPTWVNVSVFSNSAHLAAYILCTKLKELSPNIKIVISGTGISVRLSRYIHSYCKATTMDRMLSFGDFMTKRKLATAYIIGDNKQEFVNLLVNDITPGKQITLVDSFSNFDDYDLLDYSGQFGEKLTQLPFYSSRGCVRSCDFCDVSDTQGKFSVRGGTDVANEMIHLANKYQIRHFAFLDSVANGSLSNLEDWMTIISDYNKKHIDKTITWSSSGWICRPAGQMPSHLYQLMAESGCSGITIGAETGSNDVLTSIGKKTSVESLCHDIEQFRKYNISFALLFLVGHWSESWNDFLQTCKLLFNVSNYVRSGQCKALYLGYTFQVLPETPTTNNLEKNKIVGIDQIWWTSLNPELTFKERMFRLLVLEKLTKHLNLPLMGPNNNSLYSRIADSIDRAKEFYATIAPSGNQLAEYYYNNFDEFVTLVTQDNRYLSSSAHVTIDINVSVTNLPEPQLTILWNNKAVFEQQFADGQFTITLPELAISNSNKLEIKFSNKNAGDTIVDCNGNIVKDKFVELQSLSFNGIDLVKDYDFFYNKIKYTVDGQVVKTVPGFWTNQSSMLLEFPGNFLHWYSQNTNNYAQFGLPRIIDRLSPIKPDSMIPNNEDPLVAAAKLLSQLTH